VAAEHAFVFRERRGLVRAQTLKEFIEALSASTAESIRGHLERHDFSRWIDDIFGDYVLAARVRDLENREKHGTAATVCHEMIRVITERYALGQPQEEE
jgi:hypothetical protein